jgi:tRNA (guanine-N7-)-methyltransferase
MKEAFLEKASFAFFALLRAYKGMIMAPSTPHDSEKSATQADHSQPKFYGRRVGKAIRPQRKALMETYLAKIGISRPAAAETCTVADLFDVPYGQYWLEIGFGGGEHAAGQAMAHPDVGVVASEVFANGIGSLIGHIDAHDISNIRIYPEDVRQLLPHFPENSFDRIFVLFPDPWPKRRHAERRFIGPGNLPELSRLLKSGGELRVVSDDMTYVRWALRHVAPHADFMWMAEKPSDWRMPPEDWIETRYQQKAVREGRQPKFLRFQRR